MFTKLHTRTGRRLARSLIPLVTFTGLGIFYIHSTRVVVVDVAQPYESTVHHVRFEYPQGWFAEETTTSLYVSPVSPSDPRSASGIGLMSALTIVDRGAVPYEEILQQIAGQVTQTEDRMFDGNIAHKITYTDDYSGEGNVLLVITVSSSTYTIHYLTNTPLSAAFEEIVSSLHFF